MARFWGQRLLGWVCRNMWWHFEGSEISRKYDILFFQTIVFFYSLCHYLENIKDALSKCSGLVRAVVQCAQTWWPWRSRCIQERWALSALPRAGRLGYWASCKVRGAVTNFYHTCFESPVQHLGRARMLRLHVATLRCSEGYGHSFGILWTLVIKCMHL